MASSSETYYPRTEFEVKDFVPNLVPEGNYKKWRSLMLDFIDRRGLIGFIHGTAIDEGHNEHDTAWKKSDDLVQAWILSTVSDNIRLRLRGLISAEDMWNKLEYLYGGTSWQFVEDEEAGNGQAGKTIELHKAAIDGDWETAKQIIEADPDAVRNVITSLSETVLTVAVQSTSEERDNFVRQLLETMTEQDVVDLVDNQGSTALHYAALVDNMKAAKMLVQKNQDLPNAFDRNRLIPLQSAAWCGHRKMVLYLMAVTRQEILFRVDVASTLFVYLISGELYDIASYLLLKDPHLAVTLVEPSPFAILAEKHSSFLSGTSLGWWERFIYWGVPTGLGSDIAKLIEEAGRGNGRGDIQDTATANCCISVRLRLHLQGVAKKLEPYVPRIWEKKERQRRNNIRKLEKERQRKDNIMEKKERQHHALELVKSLCTVVANSNRSDVERIYKAVLGKAVRDGIPDEIVEEIASSYPSALFFTNVDNINFIKYAIMYRREHVFNLVHEVGAGWRCITGLDESNNNGLHLAARLGRKQQINLKASAAGAILQMQRELQWFKEVEKFIQPAERGRRNDDGMTPLEVFSETHQDLVQEGERWMKDTAASCTIVAALIAGMVFAAAITVPGGNDNVNGHPILSKRKAFIVFGVADALALFSSITYGVLFLLILTSRYAEADFLYTLPNKLIIGLIAVFVSILSTVVAFVAIFYLVFGNNDPLILIPIVALASIPGTLFGFLQFPLLIKMIQSTYGRSIFGKGRNRLH